MKKITDREELTQYYGKINQYIDEYIKSHRVTPTEIYRYISKNMNRFLEKYQIGDIENIDRIVKDVLEHRKNMERDKVYKFEQFNVDLNESYISVEPSSIEHEKILADYFNTSVGHVNTLDKKNHLFEVKSFDEYFKVICFSENEISKIKSEVLDLIKKEISTSQISISSLMGVQLGDMTPMNFTVRELFKEEVDLGNLVDDSKLMKIISIMIPSFFEETSFDGQITLDSLNPKSFKGYYLWDLSI